MAESDREGRVELVAEPQRARAGVAIVGLTHPRDAPAREHAEPAAERHLEHRLDRDLDRVVERAGRARRAEPGGDAEPRPPAEPEPQPEEVEVDVVREA